jgi:outer membrane protein assembly factor BamB
MALVVASCTGSSAGGPPATSPASAPPPPPATSGAPSPTIADWPGYHRSADRAGVAAGLPSGARLTVTHRIKLDGEVYASPIVAGDRTIVATEHNTVYALDRTYRVVWQRHLGAPSPQRERPCGNIDPLGITGTPVYDAASQRVFVAAEFSGSPPTHRLYALDARTGAVAFDKSLDLPGADPAAMQQRAALAVAAGRVYVAFGGLAGDCGNYKGRVIGYRLDGNGGPVAYTVPTAREAGIWAPPGVVVGADGRLYVSVGNGASGRGDAYDHSDSVLALSPELALLDSFSPTSWPTDNEGDLDLGSQGPALVGRWVFMAGKLGTGYVLRRDHLGGIGGQVSSAPVCVSFGGTAVAGDVVYVPCTDGLRAVRLDAGGHLHKLWRASSSITGSPIVGGGRVWSLDTGAGVLHALDPRTGRSATAARVGPVSRFATPAAAGSDLLVPTLSGLTVVAVG